jgi:hypothetical protein
MGNKKPTELRTASKRSAVANRKRDPLEFDEFLRKWRLCLRTPSPDWEGPRAVAELRDKKMLNFLLCEKKPYRTKSGKMQWHDNWPEWQPNDLLDRVLQEMRIYRDEAEIRLVEGSFKDVDDFLKSVSQRIETEESKTKFGDLKSVLSDLRKDVERARRTVSQRKDTKKNSQFGIWRHFWPKVPRTNLVSREIDRDTQLQVELGKMFSFYLRQNGVSLETIARLILLAYRVGGLAAQDGDVTRTIYTHQKVTPKDIRENQRKLTVRNIRENLRYKRLHKAKSFRKGGVPEKKYLKGD